MSEECKEINEQQLAAVETTQNLTAQVAETEVDAVDVAAEAAESKEDLDSSVEIIEPSETDDAAPIVIEVKDIADDILSIAMDTANIDKIDDAEESGEIIVLNDSTASETKEENLPKTTEQPMEIVEDATKLLEDNTTKKPAEAENESIASAVAAAAAVEVKSTAAKDLEQEQAMDIDAEVIAATDDKVIEETFDKQIENKDILLDNEANAISHMSSEMNDSHDSNQLIVDEKVHDATATEECEHENANDAEQTATDAVTAAEPMDIEEAPAKNESDENLQPTNNETNEATTANTMKVGDEGTTFTFTNNTQILDVIEIDDDDDDDDNNEDETNKAATPTVEMTTIEAVKETTNLETATDTSGQETTNIETTTTISSSAPTTAVQEETNQTALAVKEDMNAKKQQAANDVEQVPSKASAEIYYNKECINLECKQGSKEYYFAPDFALVFYKVRRKKPKIYFICGQCFDFVVEKYRHYSLALYNEQLLLLEDVNQRRQEFVEIIDSSDDDEADENLQQIEKSLEACTISLVERELQLSLKNVLEKVNIPIQLAGYRQKLKARSTKLIEDNAQIDEELRELQKKADKMNERLSNSVKVKHRALPAWDLNTNRPFNFKDGEALPTLLPTAELRYPAVQINEIYYTVKKQSIGSWVECRVIEQLDMQSWALKSMPHYKVKLIIGQQSIKVVPLKNLAYFEPPPVRLPIGARVIAYFDASFLMHGKEKVVVPSAFYPGIVAEPLQAKNKHRYLIFYDDGYTQYVQHKHVRLVCHESENPWDDVHPNSKEFIKKYINESTTNRPMVQTQKGQSMSVELNGKWTYGRVLAIDSSLVLMQFEGAKNYTEWIYRGSARLGPINRETKGDAHMSHVSRMPRQRTMPFVRYTDDEDKINNQAAAVAAAAAAQASMDRSNEPRAVARKSTSSTTTLPNQNQVPTVRHLNNSTIYLEDDNKPKGKVVYYTAKRNIPPLRYKRHRCSPSCLIKITHNLNAYSPLAKPLLSGWERLVFRQRIKKVVTYRGPCGKIMRNMSELHVYLRLTDNVLNVDNFDFNAEINCLAEYVIDTAKVLNRDISDGQEKMVIPLVNYYDESLPPDCKYAAQRIPTKGVPLNLDPDFLVCCDCVDDCSNKDKCACWQLTLQGVKYGNPNTPIDQIGYQYKRLLEHVPTGIYECNSRCKCKQNCLNRVAQQPLQMKLQVFKTSNRGWGLRCLNDIARGSFICIYAGYLLNETTANEGGQDAGDEYFAELDYIEVVEQMKEGYESDVRYSDEEEEEVYAPEVDDDDDFRPSKSFMTRSKRASNSNSGAERQPRNFDPNKDMDNSSLPETSIRRFYGKDETCYIMDAKITGNLGRYFNHSCSPNLFVQNVFVDTHDLRFPWVAFFASTNIRAGTELTWNYNYEVGVVPGKVLYCQCGASNCRIRLL